MDRLRKGLEPRWLVAVVFVVSITAAAGCPAQTPPAPGGQQAPPNLLPPSHIVGLTGPQRRQTVGTEAGLGDDLAVRLDGSAPLDAARYVLFLNGLPIAGPNQATIDVANHALVFRLRHAASNKDSWAILLGGPESLERPVAVSLGLMAGDQFDANRPPAPSIAGDNGSDRLSLVVISPWRLGGAILAVALVLGLVLVLAARTALLRDNMLPQLAPSRQPYSLARCQMAFWFVLVFAAYVGLYFLLFDPNTLPVQSLMLMGISGATALAAVAVDAAKDTPVDTVNAALRAIGISSYDDVLVIREELLARQKMLADGQGNAAQLSAQITDRQLKLQTYDTATRRFSSENWFRDVTTDINGTALHRLQVVCWTFALGVVFVFSVVRDLAMPEFSATILALMAISGAGYVGFKYPETQH